MDLADQFEKAGLEGISEITAANRPAWAATIARISNANDVDSLLSSKELNALARSAIEKNPEELGGLVMSVQSDLVAKALGIKVGSSRHILIRSVLFPQRLLKEGWLGLSAKWRVLNHTDNFMKSVLAAYQIDPTDFGAPARLGKTFRDLTGMKLPAEIVGNIMEDVVGGKQSAWKTIPLLGQPSVYVKEILDIFGKQPDEFFPSLAAKLPGGLGDAAAKRVTDLLNDPTRTMKLLNNINLGVLMQKGLDSANIIEQMARVQMFSTVFEDYWWRKGMPKIVTALIADPNTPPGVMDAIRKFGVKNFDELDQLEKLLTAEHSPLLLFDQFAPDTIGAHNGWVQQLRANLIDTQGKFAGDLTNPAMREAIVDNFAEAYVGLGMDYRQTMSILQQDVPWDQKFSQLLDAQFGMWPPANADFPARYAFDTTATAQERVLDNLFNLKGTGQLDDMNLTPQLIQNWGLEQSRTGRTVVEMWDAAGEGAGDLQKIFGKEDTMVRLLADQASFEFRFEATRLLPNSQRTFAKDVLGALKNNPDLAFSDAVRAEAAVFDLLMSNEQLTLREATRLVAIEGLGSTNDEIRKALTDLPVAERGKTLTQVNEVAGVSAPTPKASSPGFPEDPLEAIDRIDWAVPPIEGQRRVGVFIDGQWYFRQGSANDMSQRVFHGTVASDAGFGSDKIEAYFVWNFEGRPSIQAGKGTAAQQVSKLIQAGIPEDMIIDGWNSGGKTAREILEPWKDDPRVLDTLGASFERTPEQIRTMGVRNNSYKRFAFQWNNISGQPMAGVLDVQTGKIAYGPPNSKAWRVGGDVGSPAHVAEYYAELGQPMNSLQTRALVRRPDGAIMVAALDDADLEGIAQHLQNAGLRRDTLIFATVPNRPGFQTQDTIEAILTGKSKGGALEGVERAVWSQGVDDATKTRRLETIDSYKRSLRGLDEWQRNLSQGLDQRIEETLLTKADQQGLHNWFADLKSTMANEMQETVYAASNKVHSIYFDYGTRGIPEDMLRFVSPFTTWQMRNPVLWAQFASERPNLIKMALNLLQAAERGREKRNLTARFKGTVGFSLPQVLPDALEQFEGAYVGVDLSFILSIFDQISEPFEPIGSVEPDQIWQKFLKGMVDAGRWTGIGPWPWVDGALQKMGVLPERDLSKGVFGPVQRLIENVMIQQGIIEPWESMFGVADTFRSNQWMYYINRRLSELHAEGQITQEEFNLALGNPDNELFKKAKEQVIGIQVSKEYAGLAGLPRIKIATKGELAIREAKVVLEGKSDFERLLFREEEAEFLESYARVMRYTNDPDGVRLDIQRETLFNQLKGLHPLNDKAARDAIFDELQQLTGKRENLVWDQFGRFIMRNFAGSRAPDTFTTEEGLEIASVDSEEDVYRRLNSIQPSASMFENSLGEIDWDAFEAAVIQFEEQLVPFLSESWGFAMNADEFKNWDNRLRDPLSVVFEINRERINEGWKKFELLEPGQANFEKAAYNYITAQYQADLIAGMDHDQAATRAAEEWERVALEGLPYDVQIELLGAYIDDMPALELAPQIWAAYGLDPSEYGRALSIFPALADQTVPGMFTAALGTPRAARNALNNYYYNLNPKERREALEMIGIPLGEGQSFSAFIRTIPDDQIVQFSNAIGVFTGQEYGPAPDFIFQTFEGPVDYAGVMARLATLTSDVVTHMLPPRNALTKKEADEFEQVQRDWFLYKYSTEVERRPGKWTDLMETYYGVPDSPQAIFWETISNFNLNTVVFDDPVMGAIMSTTARGVLEFEDETFTQALEYFMQRRDVFVNEEVTAIMAANPDWQLASQESREIIRLGKNLDLEAMKTEYFIHEWFQVCGGFDKSQPRWVWRPGISERDTWIGNHPEEWQQLERYMLEQKADVLAHPEYLFFNSPRTYREFYWMFNDPTEAQEYADSLSKSWNDAIADYDAWQAGEGPWTDAMRRAMGPDPLAIPERQGE